MHSYLWGDTMQNSNKKTVRNKDSDYMLRVIGVQFLACAFIVALVFGVCRFSPDAGGQLKAKYNQLMQNNINLSEVWASVREVAAYVMKPVDVEGVQEAVSDTDEAVDENEYYTNEETTSTQVVSQKKEEAVAVMSLFSSESEIIAPVNGRITSYFGTRVDPISNETDTHNAIDIAVDEWSNVRAAWDGVVSETGYDGTRGHYIWMVHKNGCETFYCHLNEVLVNENSVIRAGETIAFSGNTGYSTGPHLHFSIKENGEYVDPLSYLNANDGEI